MTRCPWYLAGPLLGLCIVGLRAALNKPLTGLGGFIDLAENAAAPRRLGYRAFLLFGFVLGGALFAATLGSFSFSLTYGTAGGLLPAAPAAQVALLLFAGTLMGFGALTAGGCTGSHGICGTSLGSPARLRRCRDVLRHRAVALAPVHAVARRKAMTKKLAGLFIGVAIGFIMAWARLSDPAVIRSMLLLREPDVFLLMGSAALVAGVGARLLRAAGARALVTGEAIGWSVERPRASHVAGSVLFGAGWSIAATCPGPIATMTGEGRVAGLVVAAGLMVGVVLKGAAEKRLAARPLPTASVAGQ